MRSISVLVEPMPLKHDLKPGEYLPPDPSQTPPASLRPNQNHLRWREGVPEYLGIQLVKFLYCPAIFQLVEFDLNSLRVDLD